MTFSFQWEEKLKALRGQVEMSLLVEKESLEQEKLTIKEEMRKVSVSN